MLEHSALFPNYFRYTRITYGMLNTETLWEQVAYYILMTIKLSWNGQYINGFINECRCRRTDHGF